MEKQQTVFSVFFLFLKKNCRMQIPIVFLILCIALYSINICKQKANAIMCILFWPFFSISNCSRKRNNKTNLPHRYYEKRRKCTLCIQLYVTVLYKNFHGR